MTGSIHKKGKTYYIVFRIFDSEIGKQKQKWIPAGKSKRQADRKLSELIGEVHNGTYREIKKITFSEFANLWLTSYAETKTKPSTLIGYKHIINNHLNPVMGDYLLTEITTAKLQRYVAMRLQKVKPKSVVNELVPLKRMFKHAVLWGYLKVNPAEYVESPKVEKEEIEILNMDEANKLLQFANSHYRIAFFTDLHTGLRAGELWGLQSTDIDWNSKQICVRRSVWRGNFQTPKSKYSIRKVDIPDSLIHQLKKWKLACPVSEHNLVFPSPEGKISQHDNVVKRYFNRSLREAGLRHVAFHSLRHTNASIRIEKGQNIKYIQRQLGHASIQTTLDRYGHLLTEVNTEQSKKLENIFGLEHCSSVSGNSVRRLLEDFGKSEGDAISNPLPAKHLQGASLV